MVASWQPRSFASGPEPEVDGNTRMVCRYPGSSPSLIPLWKEHAFAALDDAKVLAATTEPEIDQDQWLETVLDPAVIRATPKLELQAKYNEEYRAPRVAARRTAYNLLVRWPGVLDHGLLETIQSLGLDTQRDGKQLLDLLLEPANAQTEAVQVAYNAQIAKVHSLAYDLSTPLPFSSEQPPQAEIVSFLEAYWSAIRHTDPNGVRADPKTFVKTSLLVLKRIPELKFASEWFLQTFESSGFPKLARSFIKSYKERLLTSSLPTISDLIPFDLSTAHSSTLAAMHTGPQRHGGKNLDKNRPPWTRQSSSRPPAANGRPAPRPNACDHCDARGCTGKPGGPISECACCSSDANYTRFIKKDASESEKKHILLGRKAHATGKRKNLKGVHPRELFATIFAVVCDTTELSTQLEQLNNDDEDSDESSDEHNLDTDELLGSMNALIAEVTGFDLQCSDLDELGLSYASLSVLAASTSAAASVPAGAKNQRTSRSAANDMPELHDADLRPASSAPTSCDCSSPSMPDRSTPHGVSRGSHGVIDVSGPSVTTTPTASELNITQTLHDALFQFDPPNAPVSSNPARVELRKPALGRYLVSFPILVNIHGQADAVHHWLSAQPMGSYTVSDAADLIDPDSIEQFALARLRSIRDEPDDDEPPILEFNTPSSSSTAKPASTRPSSDKRKLPAKIFGSANPNPKPFFPVSTASLVSSRPDQPEWRKNAIADLQQERSRLAAARTAAAETPPGPPKSAEPPPEHAAPPNLKTTVECSPSPDRAALPEAEPIASPSDRVAQRAEILENIATLEAQLNAATAPPYKSIDDSRSSSGSYALDPSIAPGIGDDECYISKQTPTMRRILKPFASQLHDYGVHGLLQCFVHLDIDSMEPIFDMDLNDLTSSFDTSLTATFTPGFTATADHVAKVIKSIEYLQHVKAHKLKLDNYLDYTPASTIEAISKALSHARTQLLATAANAPPPAPAAAPSTPSKATSSSDSDGWMSGLSSKQRKRALRKKKTQQEQLEDTFKADDISYENNDEPTPPSARNSKPTAQSSASPSPAPTTDSGSTSDRDSPSSSAKPADSTSPSLGDLSPTGAANAEKDLAYLDSLLASFQRFLKPFMYKLHSLGVYGQLQNFNHLDLTTIESITALSSEQIEAISVATFFAGHTPMAPDRDALIHFIRYIQYSQSPEAAPGNNFVPIDGNIND